MSEYFTSIILDCKTETSHLELIRSYLRVKEGVSLEELGSASIDIFNQEAESFKIKTVREIVGQLAYANYQNRKRWCVLMHFDLASIPAQNALLKLLEEPPANTQIILTANNTNKLLPTIISRCHNILGVEQESDVPAYFNEASQPAQQLREILAGGHAAAIDAAAGYKDRALALSFMSDLLAYLRSASKLSLEFKTQASSEILKTMEALDQNLNTQLALEQLFFKLIALSKSD